MQLFDTYVQKLKYKVLREVARHDTKVVCRTAIWTFPS